MIKSLALIILLLLGIVGTVLVIQKSTLLRSFGYDLVDFTYFFHSSEGEAQFNPSLDIYQDGTINTMDVLMDRYAQEATRSGGSELADELSSVIDSTESAEAVESAD